MSLLGLPDCTLDCILERLSPVDLCSLSGVCTRLRYRCRSDDLWEKQVERKWGRVLGDVAYQEWQWHTTMIMNTESLLLQQNQSGLYGSSIGGFGGFGSQAYRSYLENFRDLTSLIRNCSKMALFVCLHTGRFWFPIQVYKNALLYCYEAVVSYDSQTDTFRARSPTGGCRMIERNIPWDRLRLSPVETSPMDFYISNHVNDLKPGDYIEIQKRQSHKHPYDWWLAFVGHLDSCNENGNSCHCQSNDMLVVEFNQDQQGSWRKSVLDRKKCEDQGSRYETRFCWFGGMRKLEREEGIQRWNSLY